jgi:ribosomal protein S18 acetylase RimI-like enzyme
VTTVRRATTDDSRAIAAVKVASWQATYVGVVPQELLDAMDVGQHTRMWEQWLEGPSNAVFVAEQEGDVVGFVNVGPYADHEGVGELYAIYVHPEVLSTGAGLALMEAGAAWLAERWEEAVLWVAEDNPRARRFYELFGWVAGTTRVVDVLPGAPVPEVLYRLSLAGR